MMELEVLVAEAKEQQATGPDLELDFDVLLIIGRGVITSLKGRRARGWDSASTEIACCLGLDCRPHPATLKPPDIPRTVFVVARQRLTEGRKTGRRGQTTSTTH